MSRGGELSHSLLRLSLNVATLSGAGSWRAAWIDLPLQTSVSLAPDSPLPPEPPDQVPPAADPPTGPSKPSVAFDQLAQGQSEVLIEYQGQFYRLRSTRNGKLVLNK